LGIETTWTAARLFAPAIMNGSKHIRGGVCQSTLTDFSVNLNLQNTYQE
jgi:hypothetical protein